MQGLQGAAYAEKALALAAGYHQQGEWRKAAELAGKAYEEAKKASAREWMAEARHQEGKSMLIFESKKSKATKKLQESIDLTQNKELKRRNLNLMREVALEQQQSKELQRIAAELEALDRSPAEVATDESSGNIFNRKRKEQEQMAAKLSDELQKISTDRERLQRQQSSLINTLERQQTAIGQMSEAQAKAELMLSMQKNLLDSLSFVSLLDSLKLEQREMLLEQKEIVLKKQEMQLNLERSQRYLLLALAVLILLIAFGLYNRNQNMKRHSAVLEAKNQIILEEKKRSEELLLNILPAAIAEELKARGAAQARHYDQVSVLFTDFRNFSQIADSMSPERLVEDLDYCFRNFDRIVTKHGLEKIKTIGDAYMCAGGLPDPQSDHPLHIVQAAFEIREFLEEWKKERVARNEPYFEARIGINTGPLVAGVVGAKKFAYDIWGNTVNVAARIESAGEPGRINVSEATYQLVQPHFQFENRGHIAVKNMGDIKMYFVEPKKG